MTLYNDIVGKYEQLIKTAANDNKIMNWFESIGTDAEFNEFCDLLREYADMSIEYAINKNFYEALEWCMDPEYCGNEFEDALYDEDIDINNISSSNKNDLISLMSGFIYASYFASIDGPFMYDLTDIVSKYFNGLDRILNGY